MWSEGERQRVVRLCAAISGERHAAEDLAQETLLEAWRHRGKLLDPTGAERWVAAVARNVCLRWSRTRATSAPPIAEVPEVEAPALADDLVELLELLPQPMREVLVLRYALDWTCAEIAQRLGVSGDAVSMRLARAKAELRRRLDADEWRPTGIWCIGCGAHRLLTRRERAGASVAFRCTGCDPDRPTAVFPLDNPLFGRLVGGLERPTAMFGRVGDWAVSYWSAGKGSVVACTRCGAGTTVEAHTREDTATRGFYVDCARCGEQLWSSLVGLAMATPEVRELRRHEPRTHAAPERELTDAILVPFGAVSVAFEHGTHRLLGVR